MYLGKAVHENNMFFMEPQSLLRHSVVLGNSGCGKTIASKVIVEEALLKGIPVIAVDPQGDISSMGLESNDEAWNSQVETAVWTPASSAGIPICLDPLIYSEIKNLSPEDQCKAISSMSKSLVELIAPKSTKKGDIEAYLDLCLQWIVGNRLNIENMEGFANFLEELHPILEPHVERVISPSLRKDVLKKFHILLTGSSKLLFNYGSTLSIEELITPSDNTKTRLSVLYLNTLQSQEEKAFFVNRLLYKIYNWMLKNPSDKPQLLFYMDEVAPYIPPVRVTVCKRYFDLLLRQGRKYGVCALLSTQNPGDIDYKIISQVSTWFLGKMITSQDIKKVENAIRSNTINTEKVIRALPQLKSGGFYCISPSLDKPSLIQFRFTRTPHVTLCEKDIEEIPIPLGLKDISPIGRDLYDVPIIRETGAKRKETYPSRSSYRRGNNKLSTEFGMYQHVADLQEVTKVIEGIKFNISI
jgi:hypothetical protein